VRAHNYALAVECKRLSPLKSTIIKNQPSNIFNVVVDEIEKSRKLGIANFLGLALFRNWGGRLE
jgi:hypothetical protein